MSLRKQPNRGSCHATSRKREVTPCRCRCFHLAGRSYAQPEWLIDRANSPARFPPRVRARELWRWRRNGSSSAGRCHLLAIRDQERAGLESSSRRECGAKSTPRSHRAIEGVDIAIRQRARSLRPPNPSARTGKSGVSIPVRGPRRSAFLRQHDRMIKMTVPGPFTMSSRRKRFLCERRRWRSTTRPA